MDRETRRRPRVRRSVIRMFVVVGFVIVCAAIGILASRGLLARNGGDVPLANNPLAAQSSRLRSSQAILIRLHDHAVLMDKRSEERVYPASLTKIMTAIVAIENLPDLQEEIELPDSIFGDLYRAEASMAGFWPAEKVQAIDLLYGSMLPSGAECTIGLANQIAGSELNFVQMMNEKAAKLGMSATHFSNATGLHDRHHYTSVKDLAALLSYALQNETFRAIFTSARHVTPPTNLHPHGVTLPSTLFSKLRESGAADGEILGGKTGYTEQAGLCLASLASVSGQDYILVTVGAKGDLRTVQYNITDALAVYRTLRGQASGFSA